MIPNASPATARDGFSLWEGTLALVLAPLVVFAAVKHLTGQNGLAPVGDDQVAVMVDGWTGARELVTTPGFRTYLPWLQEVLALDKAPNGLVFTGNEKQGPARSPRLIARARDGSTYWFETFPLVYALRTERAAEVLDDAGPGDAWKRELVAFYARSILRDELGRYDSEEISSVQNLRAAARAAQERLNRALERHGIEVLEIATPKPSFDKAYEDHIQRRKLNDQERERLSSQLDELAEERNQRQAAARREKEVEFEKLGDNLAHDLKVAANERLRLAGEADRYFLERVKAAEATRIEKEKAAGSLREKYVAFARDLSNQSKDLERYGELAVRMALIDKLSGIEFSLVPYSRDPAPQRLEVLQSAAGAGKIGGAP